MPKVPPLTPKQILRILEKKGFEVDHVTGSHYILYHPITKARVTVAYHTKALSKGTIHSILKSAGLTMRDIEKN